MIKTTIYIPDELYEELRLKAFQDRTSINKLILAKMGVENPPEPSEDLRKAIKEVENRVVRESRQRQKTPEVNDL